MARMISVDVPIGKILRLAYPRSDGRHTPNGNTGSIAANGCTFCVTSAAAHSFPAKNKTNPWHVKVSSE
jgi:hypothetical protein